MLVGRVAFRQVSNPSQVLELTSQRKRLRVSGNDRVAFLHGQCTQDIKRLRPGASCYAAFLTAKGKMRGDADILCGDDALLLSSVADLQGTLEKFVIAEDVVIEDVSARLGEWAVWGAAAPAGELVYPNRLGGWNVLGVAPAGEPITADTVEVWRVEHGVPLWGVDMDETTIPVEAGLAAWAIDYNKGCYIGQETIARIKTYGHVNRQLVQLALAAVPARGTPILAGGKPVGQITSAMLSVKLGKALALGYVRREFVKTGGVLEVATQPAEVIKPCGE